MRTHIFKKYIDETEKQKYTESNNQSNKDYQSSKCCIIKYNLSSNEKEMYS